MDWVLEAVDESAVSNELNAAIIEGLCEAFPADRETFSKGRGWHGSWPEFSVVARDADGRVLGHVAIVERRLTVGDVGVTVGGVQSMFVNSSMRGTGLSAALMGRAMEESRSRGYDCGLLFCVPSLEKVYSSMGWLVVGERDIVRREGDRLLPLPEKNMAMIYPLKLSSLPDGAIDLRGNDW